MISACLTNRFGDEKAKEHGEDLVSPLIEQAATAVMMTAITQPTP